MGNLKVKRQSVHSFEVSALIFSQAIWSLGQASSYLLPDGTLRTICEEAGHTLF